MQHIRSYLAVGSYASKESSSIYLYIFDPQSAHLIYLNSFTGIENPSFLAINARQNRFYAVSETMTFDGQSGGSVASFSLNPETAQITLLNQQATYGGAPCHLTLSPDNSWLLVANYMGGNINLFPILSNGEIGPITSNIQHTGQLGPRTDRQEASHPHSIPLDPTGNYAFVPDLGLDTIFTYKLDTEHGKLVPYGHFLLAANQDSDSIVTYSVNQDTDRLTFENSIQVPHPVCLKFAQIS